MEESTGIRVAYPDPKGGTSTTGNVARRLLYDGEVREELLSQVPEHRRDNLRQLMKQFSVVLRVLSSKQTIENLGTFRIYCQNLYQFIVEKYPPPHCFLSPTVHKILGHGWELIEKNDGKGLGMLSEGGIEACNKLLRRFRISLSRKCDQLTNLTDCINRLFIRSDPVLNILRRDIMPKCKLCSTVGHTKRECPKAIRVLTEENSAISYFGIEC